MMMPGYGNLTLSMKVALAVASTCVLSVGVMLKHFSSVALAMPSMVSELVVSSSSSSGSDHSFWNVVMLEEWLKPPYLYLLINAIIISIVASSKLQQQHRHHHRRRHDHDDNQTVSAPPPETVIVEKLVGDVISIDDRFAELDKPAVAPPPHRSDSMEFSEKPPGSATFGNRKSAVKANPEGGRSLRVSRSKRDETLESTWKTITEGRAMPLARHLKKSDTWDSHVRQQPPPPPPSMKEAETITESTSSEVSRLKREPSLSQDELNRRVEAFIKKFNEEMRLQRQRSLEQYHQMIRRGAN